MNSNPKKSKFHIIQTESFVQPKRKFDIVRAIKFYSDLDITLNWTDYRYIRVLRSNKASIQNLTIKPDVGYQLNKHIIWNKNTRKSLKLYLSTDLDFNPKTKAAKLILQRANFVDCSLKSYAQVAKIFEQRLRNYTKLKKIAFSVEYGRSATNHLKLLSTFKQSKSLKKVVLNIFSLEKNILEKVSNFISTSNPSFQLAIRSWLYFAQKISDFVETIGQEEHFTSQLKLKSQASQQIKYLDISFTNNSILLEEFCSLILVIQNFSALRSLNITCFGVLFQNSCHLLLYNLKALPSKLKNIGFKIDNSALLNLLWKYLVANSSELETVMIDRVNEISEEMVSAFKLSSNLAKLQIIIGSDIDKIYNISLCRNLVFLNIHASRLSERNLEDLILVWRQLKDLKVLKMNITMMSGDKSILLRFFTSLAEVRALHSLCFIAQFLNQVNSKLLLPLLTFENLKYGYLVFDNLENSDWIKDDINTKLKQLRKLRKFNLRLEEIRIMHNIDNEYYPSYFVE